MHLVVEDVTRIGTYAFFGINPLLSCELPEKSLLTIGDSAFQGSRVLSFIEIPDTVTEIGAGAFFDAQNLKTVILHEGLQKIGKDAFYSTGITELHYPSTLKVASKIAGSAAIKEITVAEENPNYTVYDGVLYGLREDGTWELDLYPGGSTRWAYEVPAKIKDKPVTTITGVAFAFVPYLQEVTIPNVSSIGGFTFRNSSVRKVTIVSTYLEDRGAFLHTYSMDEVVISNLTNLPNQFFWDSALKKIEIPACMKTIEGHAFYSCLQLSDVRYDAVNATIGVRSGDSALYDVSPFTLTIGKNVDHLPENFASFSKNAEVFRFDKGNTFTAEEGAFVGAIEPLDGLYGLFYVDAQGLVYLCNEATKTAALVYCQPGIGSAEVPESVTPDNGTSYTVTSVGANALKYAEDLTSLDFVKPSNITQLATMAMANCPTLTSVCKVITVEEATAMFNAPNIEIGYNVFYNTGLIGAPAPGTFEANMDGKKYLEIGINSNTLMKIQTVTPSAGNTMKWETKNAENNTGGYHLLTGDTANIAVSVGNIGGASDYVFRVYLRLTDEGGNLGITPGSSKTFDGQTVTCFATEDPYTVYLEFVPAAGVTVSFPVEAVYPALESAGGGLTVWGVILTEEEADKAKEKLVASESGTLQFYWTTKRNEFTLVKTATGSNPGIASDGQGGAKPSVNLNWRITFNRPQKADSSFGKDYVKAVDFTDVMTFPEGVSWNETVKQAIIDGKVRYVGKYLCVDDTRIVELGYNYADLTIRRAWVTWNEELDTAEFHWRVESTKLDEEMDDLTVSFYVFSNALSVDMKAFNGESNATITNRLKAQVQYTHSGDTELYSEASHTISGGVGTIAINKLSSDVTYFGEDFLYTLEVYNGGGLPWHADQEGVYTVNDNLYRDVYISPENMERMFADEYGDQLTITIKNARLGEWVQVMGTDGTVSWQHPGNSDIGTDGHTLTITRNADGTKYTVAVTDGGTYANEKLAAALQAAGYAVSENAAYSCAWKLNEESEPFMLDSGEKRTFLIYSTVKDTFHLVKADDKSVDLYKEYAEYCTNTRNILNNASVLKPDKKTHVGSNNCWIKVKREAIINKSASREGQPLPDTSLAEDKDVLDYSLEFIHYGEGSYENLPMVDMMYGSQYLMVPVVEKNSHLDGLVTFEDKDGTLYYLLTAGKYNNVTVGTDDEGNALVAASIEVTPAESEKQITLGEEKLYYSGLYTKIKWYFPGKEGGNYRLIVSYKALVDYSLSELSYTVGNVVWMNDRTSCRLYNSIWGGGTTIDFEKRIVTEKGDTPEEDVVTDYSHIAPGEKVTYRLMLKNDNQSKCYLPGTKLADALPNTFGIFRWEENVSVTMSGIQTQGEVVHTGLDQWYLGNQYGYVEEGGNRQFILWPETASITFNGSGAVYLYFTLTYPKNSATADSWSQYTKAAAGNSINNAMYVDRYASTVDHELQEDGKVLLQKGVYGVYTLNDSYVQYRPGISRQCYNNKDYAIRGIVYYVTLYNGANKRLYLNDLQDKLPQGFTYKSLLSRDPVGINNTVTNCITTTGGSSLGDFALAELSDTEVTYCSAAVNAEATKGRVKFSFGAGSGDNAVSYDQKRGKYYLNQDQAIVFGYVCEIGESGETEQAATNTIAMPYDNYLDTELSIVREEELDVTAAQSEYFDDLNDGNCRIKAAQQAEQEYGFSAGTEEKWLVSEVTVHKGAIIPGIKKSTVSYVTEGSTDPIPYINHVGPNDTVNWCVQLYNAGMQSMTDYTFTDIMPAPYVVEGAVTYMIYDARGNQLHDNPKTLAIFPTERAGSEEEVTISGKKVPFNGTEMAVTHDNITHYVSLRREEDANGKKNEILTVRMDSPLMTIPEGGHMKIFFSSSNPTNSYANTVYTNRAILTPNIQNFDEVVQGSKIQYGEERYGSVESASPVTVSFGYATGSEKRVTEKKAETNTAVSTNPDRNRIILGDAGSIFTYTLTVDNDTDKAMTKLVLIDNLPEEADHTPFHTDVSRSSAFAVKLAEDPNFKVTVTTSDGNSYELESEKYTVQYSATTNFGGPQSKDWQGEDTGIQASWADKERWTTGLENVRAIRVMIRDESATQIPAKSSISVCFDAQLCDKAKEEAEAGTTAWNSFGYHYGLKDVASELEAMPLPVGVTIPQQPCLQKKLVDAHGAALAAAEETTFRFLVYEGTALTESYDTKETLIAALTAEKRAYKQFAVTVKEGGTESETVTLDWTWKKDASYTVVELPPENQKYVFSSIGQKKENVYSFVYTPAESNTIVCTNTLNDWSILLTKVDDTGEALAGAVFALYSPEESDQIEVPEEYQDIHILQETTVEEKTWYLAAVYESAVDGKVVIDNLVQGSYYLREVKAPDGYMLSMAASKVISRTDATQQEYNLTVINRKNIDMPETGGTGIQLYGMGCLPLLLAMGILAYTFIRKRGRSQLED